ncbi:hypothetical protein [Hyphomicrobium sp. DMF-1]|jgi:O-acetyl-ADP-ribose deacetylase (regulator of RNase III)|uniref:hypothetical protein n=1 Tax=Hyphomicrobium sp. DMF-1 TaxID=3019544 RepID=UPI0022EBC839|nr:hypothetical protein [Hyphomicrobium sp. DMF-1]WBT39802.1 hypothetical protein PE058_07950 [Hyphomicrobium sp. DMF-1]
MDKNSGVMREAVQRIKEAIYDAQIGEAEITPSRKQSEAYVVKFDTRAGRAGEVSISSSLGYREIVALLKSVHEEKS